MTKQIRLQLIDLAGQEGNDGEIYNLMQEAAEYIRWLEYLVHEQCGLSDKEINKYFIDNVLPYRYNNNK